MAVLLHERLFGGIRGRPLSVNNHRDYLERWLVEVDAPDVSAVVVCSAIGLPQPGDAFADDPDALLYDYVVYPYVEGEWAFQVVECLYSTDVAEGGPPGLLNLPDNPLGVQRNPWDEYPTVEVEAETVHRSPRADLDGTAYTTSAGMPFSPPPTFDFGPGVLLVTWNLQLADFGPSQAAFYSYAVNDAPFLDAPAGCVLSMPPRARLRYRGLTPYWQATFRLKFGELDDTGEYTSWQPKILDAGYHRIQDLPESPDIDKPIPIVRFGQPPSQPILLDGHGQPLVIADPLTVVPVFREFRQRRSIDLSTLIPPQLM